MVKKIVPIVLILVFCVFALRTANAQKTADLSKLGPRLYKMVKAHQEKKAAEPFTRMQERRPDEEKVTIIMEASRPEEASEALRSRGFVIETTYKRFIQVSLPLSAIEEIIKIPAVRSAKLPMLLNEHAITSEGLPLIRVPVWHSRGLTGEGVKVAVLDRGFQGYDALLGSELPNSLTVRSFRYDGVIDGISDHGTACAEIVHDVAPEADLYLVNFKSFLELGNAVQWLIDEGVHVISCSLGFPSAGPDDGTGAIPEIMNHARENGILCVVSAGNDAQRHWSGPWRDDNGDGLLDFQVHDGLRDDSMSIQAKVGDVIWAVLKWDDPWGASHNDYDLILRDMDGYEVDSSTRPQEGMHDPLEEIQYTAPKEGYYNLYISQKPGAGSVTFRLFVPSHGLERWVEEGSLMTPASAPSALTVGAFDAGGAVRLEPFSSRGPTVDGRTKPDILAPDRVTTSTESPFPGTSASTPHVAGAAALVKQLHPGYSPAEIQEFLEDRAIDVGPPGKENAYGSGLVSLDPPQTWVVDIGGKGDFTTIQGGINASAPGDTITVQAGTYTENVKVNKPLTIRGNGVYPGAVTIDRNEADRIVVEIGSPNCILEWVGLNSSVGSGPEVVGIQVRGTDYNIIRTTIVQGCGTGIEVGDEDIVIPPWWNRAPIRPEHNMITGSVIVSNSYKALHMYNGDENVVRDNLMDGNSRIGAFIVGDRNCVVDNQISQNSFEGLVIRGNANIFCNNLVKENHWGGMILESGSNNVFRSNTFQGNGCSGCSWPTPSLSIEAESINQVCRNVFLEKVNDHAWDEHGTGIWDDGVRGNYWDDYTGEDQDGDGLGDTAYILPGDGPQKGQDNFPVTRQDMLAVLRGDLTGDGATGLRDAVFALQVVSGMRQTRECLDCVSEDIDANGDNRIGLAEAIYALQVLVGFTP
jgi:parallel beta-helix repeat protein